MAKKTVKAIVKLQVPGRQGHARAARSAPRWDPTASRRPSSASSSTKGPRSRKPGVLIPVVITIYTDKSFTFITKTPPAAVLIKKALGLEKGSGEPNKTKVGALTKDKLRAIAEQKMPDLTAKDIEAAMKIIAGTARSMGVTVEG